MIPQISEIESVECIGEFEDEYVYDIEMSEDTEHTFFANDMLVHNSVYLTINEILRLENIQLTDGKKSVTPEAKKLIEEIESVLNNEITEWAKKTLYTIDPRFVFKREVIADRGVFLIKKRYILHVIDDEGVAVDKFKYTGVEVARSTTPKKVKSLIKAVTEKAIMTGDIRSANAEYADVFDQFSKMEPDDIAIRSSVNNLDQYASDIDIYSFKKGTPSHVKAAIAYNMLLVQHKLDKELEPIASGSKAKKLYCKPNKYKLDAIAYQTALPKEFGIEPDYEKMFDKLITSPIQKIYESLSWHLPPIGKEVQTDMFELFG
jgi:hypothetical protein